MNKSIRQIGILLLVGFLVVQPMAAPVAAAGDDGPGVECFGRGLLELAGVAQCDTPAEDNAEDRSGIWTSALSASDVQKTANAGASNQLQYTRNTCLCQMKASVIESLQNNESLATAKTEANATIDSYYADLQHNTIEAHQSQISTMYYLHERANTGGYADVLRVDTATTNTGASTEDYDTNADWGVPYYTLHTSTETVTLLDGTTKNVTAYYQQDTSDSAKSVNYGLSPFTDTFTDYYGNNANQNYDNGIYVLAPGVAPSTTTPTSDQAEYTYQEQDWRDTWTGIQSEHDYVTTNSMTYIDEIYAAYSDGKYSDQDPTAISNECDLSVRSADKDGAGSLSWTRAALGTLGISADVNTSMQVTYTPSSGETFRGATELTASTENINMSNPSLGDGAVITTDEKFSVNLSSNATLTNTTVTLRDTNESTAITSVPLTDADGDGVYVGNLPDANTATLANGDTVLATIDTEADGTAERITLGTWTYAPNGGVSVELDGGLYTDWEPTATNGSFQTNTIYNTADTSEPVQFIDTDGENQGNHALKGEFTINTMYDASTGEEINQTTMVTYNTQTFNASMTQEEVDRVMDYINQAEDNWESTGTVGIGGSIGDALSGLWKSLGVGAIIVLGVLGMILYASRTQK